MIRSVNIVVSWDLILCSSVDGFSVLEELDILVIFLLGKECQRVRNFIEALHSRRSANTWRAHQFEIVSSSPSNCVQCSPCLCQFVAF
jgi:hypothetical protein